MRTLSLSFRIDNNGAWLSTTISTFISVSSSSPSSSTNWDGIPGLVIIVTMPLLDCDNVDVSNKLDKSNFPVVGSIIDRRRCRLPMLLMLLLLPLLPVVALTTWTLAVHILVMIEVVTFLDAVHENNSIPNSTRKPKVRSVNLQQLKKEEEDLW
jgi:hypothetical protein